MPHNALLARIRAEYLEMPGLRLTCEQAQRLFHVERTQCQQVLKVLIDTNFLCIKANGVYARVTDGAYARPRTAKASRLGSEYRKQSA